MSSDRKKSQSSLSEEIEDYLKVLQKGLEKVNETIEQNSTSQENVLSDISDDVFISSFENQFSTWMSWFYNTIVYLLIINVFFFTSIFNSQFQSLAIGLIILFPFYLWWAFLNSIPEIIINDEIVFSRRDLTLRRQITLGRTLFTYFSKEMVKNSPWGTLFLSFAILSFVVVLVATFIL